MKLLGVCVGYLMGTESGVSCDAGATISLTDTTLLCILDVGGLIGALVVATLEILAGEEGTSIRLVGKTASVDCWMALDSLSRSRVLSCPVGKNIGTVSPLPGAPCAVLLYSSLLLGVVVRPGNTHPSYS